jgi:hypothetical protein
MLTHTWFLDRYLKDNHLRADSHDIFIYNILPDLLPIHGETSVAITHGIDRTGPTPAQHWKTAFIRFHLIVDDMAHHGRILAEAESGFDTTSRGYAYRKGRFLVDRIKAIYRGMNHDISPADAMYYAHMIIESAFDIVLYRDQRESGLLEIFCDVIKSTASKSHEELYATIQWLYGMDYESIDHSFKEAREYRTLDKMRPFMTLEGRIPLYLQKLGMESLRHGHDIMKFLMEEGMELVEDYEEFVVEVQKAIQTSNFPLSLKGFLDKS